MHFEPSASSTPSTPKHKMTRKPSFPIFPLTPPRSSHSPNQPQIYTAPHSPIFSDPTNSTMTPASTPPRSMASPQQAAAQIPIPITITRFPCTLPPDPNLAQYYNTKSKNDTTYRINNSLLRVVALLAHGTGTPHAEFFEQALNLADVTLALATESELWDMVSKCHLYRTYCFMEMRRWKEARQAVTRAATIRAWGYHIETVMCGIEQGEKEEVMLRRQLHPGLPVDEFGDERR
ncbi:hypothetical protein ONS95_003005 [Cadophora gregata]|uniref:uncharacterized protein n=1 Tax=Cadophora gregata TaxID=51156 RepID=UPI0026DD00F1|nr:uncharacterized protein ONS95_003005 [Cadophora gregata]KAK0108183.1 hypothetical protein ONS95_003005 [Cadophora gregata]KAK0109223.1 hypothetical protein ONS96_003046 [Cadophora gregata f. sp. sojae]